jgi:hypothetical protein
MPATDLEIAENKGKEGGLIKRGEKRNNECIPQANPRSSHERNAAPRTTATKIET